MSSSEALFLVCMSGAKSREKKGSHIPSPIIAGRRFLCSYPLWRPLVYLFFGSLAKNGWARPRKWGCRVVSSFLVFFSSSFFLDWELLLLLLLLLLFTFYLVGNLDSLSATDAWTVCRYCQVVVSLWLHSRYSFWAIPNRTSCWRCFYSFVCLGGHCM